MTNEKRPLRAIGALLYALPVIFLIVAYLFMTVTAEDVGQGAGAGAGFIHGVLYAFGYNARLSDMYAYGIIPYFDYQFSMNVVNILLRLVDVAMALGIFYVMTLVILGRRPRLQLADGAVFALSFMFVFLSPFGESLYIAFSHIHNYLIICLFSALFLLPFALKLMGKELPKGIVFRFVMLILGFMFGFSCNVTPAAFLVTLAVWGVYVLIRDGLPKVKSVLTSWVLPGVVGVLAACFIMYVMGTGVSHYTSVDYQVDYISISAALHYPLWVVKHIRANFWTMMPCLLPMVISLIFEIIAYKKHLLGKKGADGVLLSAACLLFVVMHTLAVSQILVEGILRLMMPAYLTAIVATGFTLVRMMSLVKLPWQASVAGALVIAAMAASMVVDMTRFRMEYNRKIESVLEEIKLSDEELVYISRSDLAVEESKFFGFTQYQFLADWMLYPTVEDWHWTQPIYGKHITLKD